MRYARRTVLLALLAAQACVDFGALSSEDSAPPIDLADGGAQGRDDAGSLDAAANDGAFDSADGAGRTCRWDAPFTTEHEVAGLEDSAFDVAVAQLAPDERAVYFQVRSGVGATFDFFRATRGSIGDPFGARDKVAELSDPIANDTSLTVSSSGLVAIFESDRASDGGTANSGLFVARRSDASAPFDAPLAVTTLGLSFSAHPILSPYLTEDGVELWLGDLEPDAAATYVASVAADAGLGLASLRVDVPGTSPVLSADKQTVYYALGTGSGTNAVRVAHRDSPLAQFGPGAIVAEITVGGETPSFVSRDLCRLYFTTRRNTRAQVFVAERSP